MRKGLLVAIVICLSIVLLLPACTDDTTPTPAPSPSPTVSPTPGEIQTPDQPPEATPETTPVPTQEPPKEAKIIKISYSTPKGKSMGGQLDWLGPEFEKRTEGRYKVEIYPSSTLVSPTAVLDSVKGRMAEIATTSTGIFSRDFPLNQVTGMPAAGLPIKHLDNPDAYHAVNEIWNEFALMPEIAAELQDYKLLHAWFSMPSILVSQEKVIKAPEDLKGVKLGGAGPTMDLAKQYGGAGVPLIVPQYYENLDKGTVNAAIISVTAITDWHMDEILDYYYLWDFGTGTFLCLMNQEAWNEMSPEDQQLLEETVDDMLEQSIPVTVEQAKNALRILEEAGKVLNYPTAEETAAWEEASEVCYTKWKDDCMALGIDEATVDKVRKSWVDLRDSYVEKYNLK